MLLCCASDILRRIVEKREFSVTDELPGRIGGSPELEDVLGAVIGRYRCEDVKLKSMAAARLANDSCFCSRERHLCLRL